MAAQTAGFIGPLFSRGLAHTGEFVNALATRLIEAKREGDWSRERFDPIDALHRRNLTFNDELIHGSFVAFRNPALFIAWIRPWLLSQSIPELDTLVAELVFRHARNPAVFDGLERLGERPLYGELHRMWADCVSVLNDVEEGGLVPIAAAGRIYDTIDRYDLGPVQVLVKDRNKRVIAAPRPREMVSFLRYLVQSRDPVVRDHIAGHLKSLLKAWTLGSLSGHPRGPN